MIIGQKQHLRLVCADFVKIVKTSEKSLDKSIIPLYNKTTKSLHKCIILL